MTTFGLGHINLRARRQLLDELKAFYCDVVGLADGPRPSFSRFGYWLYAGSRPVVHLFEALPDEERRTDVATTFDHVAFECADLHAVETSLRALGVPYGTSVVPESRQVQLFVRDPAGNGVELSFAPEPR